MEKDSTIKILYRMAEKQNKTSKTKPEWVNNRNCFLSLYCNLKDGTGLKVFGDRLKDSKIFIEEEVHGRVTETKNHGNAQTFLEVLDYAINELDPEDTVYFVEDDYIHRSGFIDIIREGLERVDYVSLYDHPDKYQYENEAILFYTKSTHWRLTSSTTMTFACKVKTLQFDYQVFEKYCQNQTIPQDYYLWNYLTKQLGRKLATPIPGFATHGETKWLAPVINWKKYL